MDAQFSQGSLADFDVVRSTQFVDDFPRQVRVSLTLVPHLAQSKAWHLGHMGILNQSNVIYAVLCNIAPHCMIEQVSN